jgi:hypothetical protein
MQAISGEEVRGKPRVVTDTCLAVAVTARVEASAKPGGCIPDREEVRMPEDKPKTRCEQPL